MLGHGPPKVLSQHLCRSCHRGLLCDLRKLFLFFLVFVVLFVSCKTQDLDLDNNDLNSTETRMFISSIWTPTHKNQYPISSHTSVRESFVACSPRFHITSPQCCQASTAYTFSWVHSTAVRSHPPIVPPPPPQHATP